MQRAGRRETQEARLEVRRHVQANRAFLTRFLLTMTAVFSLVTAGMAIWRGRELAFFMAGASSVGLAWLTSVALDSAQVRRHRYGALGERCTGDALRHVYGEGWRCVDDVPLNRGNVDHVAAGPGGAYAIETKWTNCSWDLVNGQFRNSNARRATWQAKQGAQRIASMLKTSYGIVADIRPVLVIWGPGCPTLQGPVRVDGLRVVAGSDLATALKNTPRVMDNERRDEIIDAIEHIVALHEEVELGRSRHGDDLVDIRSRRAS